MVDINAGGPRPSRVLERLRRGAGGIVGSVLGRVQLPEDIDERVAQIAATHSEPVEFERDEFPEGFGPEQLTPGRFGEQSWKFELSMSGHRVGTAQFDKWVLGLEERPGDPEFNNIVREHKIRAQQRERLRERWSSEHRGGSARIGGQIGSIVEQTRRVVEDVRPSVVMLGPDGTPLPEQFRVNRDGTIEGFQRELSPEERMTFAGMDPQLRAEMENALGLGVLQPNEYLWMGEMAVGEDGQPTDSFMSVQDAATLPYHWSLDQVMFAQEAFGMDPTGFVDDRFMNAWASIVSTSAGYTAAGRDVSPFLLLDMLHDSESARRAGGGGGGGQARAYSQSETTGLLNQVMQNEVGRESNAEESRAFHGALNAAGDVDPAQFAIEWVREQVGQEAGAFQVATDYYQAMMQVLGNAGSEAVSPVGG